MVNPLAEPDLADDQDSFAKEREQIAATILMAKKQAALRKYTPLKRGLNNALAPHAEPIEKKIRNSEGDSSRENMLIEAKKGVSAQDSFLAERNEMAAALLEAKQKMKSGKNSLDKIIPPVVESVKLPISGREGEKKESAEHVSGQDSFLTEREEMAALLLAAKKRMKSGKKGLDMSLPPVVESLKLPIVGREGERKESAENVSVKAVLDLNLSIMDPLAKDNSKNLALQKTYCGTQAGNEVENLKKYEEVQFVPIVQPIRIRLTKEFPPSHIRKILIAKAKIDLGEKMETLKNVVYQDDSVVDVPDPEFHDFDEDRTRHAFQKRQVWACYDDDDGMPRFYAFVQKILSAKRFKILISYLKSPSTAEFGRLSWIGSGFVKTIGHFRVEKKCEILRAENLFSHMVDWEQGPQGTIRIFPRCGEVWALYKNWSPEWSALTPDEVIHEYEMVEVLEEYKKEKRCCVVPLVKVEGFSAVYKRVDGALEAAKIVVKKEEMLRFSHRVPAFKLDGVMVKDGGAVLDGCYELDAAALPVALDRAKETST